MITRRTFLVAGAGAVVATTAAVSVGVGIVRRPWPLRLAEIAPLLGARFVDDETGRTLTLHEIDGPGGSPTEDAFTLRFRTGDTADLPGAIRTLVHDDRSLTLYLGPVGPEGDSLEANVLRRA